jgi:hypothetical protein
MNTANFKGIPIAECIHAPSWMQAIYFAMGPAYYTACSLYKTKRIKTFKTKE